MAILGDPIKDFNAVHAVETADALHEKLVQMNSLHEQIVRIQTELVGYKTCESHRKTISDSITELKQAHSKWIGIALTLVVVSSVFGALLGAILAHVVWK